MLGPFLAFLTRNKYKLAIIGLLLGASLLSVFMLIARMAYSDTQQFRGLIWNLFLAWIPFVLAYIAYALSWHEHGQFQCFTAGQYIRETDRFDELSLRHQRSDRFFVEQTNRSRPRRGEHIDLNEHPEQPSPDGPL